MNIYSVIANLGSLFAFILGIYVFYKDSRKSINYVFFLMCLSMAGYILLANASYSADTKEHLILYYKSSSFFFGTYFAINLHFILILTKYKLNIPKLIFLYIPVFIVIYTTLTSNSLFSDFIRDEEQWNFVPAYRSFGFYFYILYTIIYITMSVCFVENYRRKSNSNKEKQMAKIINVAYASTLIGGLIVAFTLPIFNIYYLSPIGPNMNVIYLFTIYYSVFRFKFLNVMPSIITDDIIENISDMVLLLDTNLIIIRINNKCTETLGLTAGDQNKKSVYNIIPDKEESIEHVKNFLNGAEKSLNSRFYFQNNEKQIMADAYISKIYDKFHDLAGYLVIAKEIRGIKEFMERYKLTVREFDVIKLLITGISNKEISEKLNVAESTTKSHIEHIYNKTGACNKVELVNLLKKSNLSL